VSRARGRGPVVAVVDWRAAVTLKDNAVFLRRAGLPAAGRPRRGERPPVYRSLIVRADGSGELQSFTPATAGRRLLAGTAATTSGKTETERRG